MVRELLTAHVQFKVRGKQWGNQCERACWG